MNTKTVYLLTILLSVFVAGAALAQNQGGNSGEQSGICFQPMDFDRNVCINFRTSWYYPYALSEWMVLHVRTSGTPAGKHIWNSGQYLMTFEEWEKVRTALAGQGLPERCLHPEYRMSKEDQVKTRKAACKLN
ncbi:MAG: hypothetical protein RIF32_03300 [Leptospirales bacterium]